MKTIAWILGLMLLVCVCVAGDLIGAIVPPFPDGWKNQGGSCIAGSLGIEKSCEYSIGVAERANQLILYFGKYALHTVPKKARWLVTDQCRTQKHLQVIKSSMACAREMENQTRPSSQLLKQPILSGTPTYGRHTKQISIVVGSKNHQSRGYDATTKAGAYNP